MTILKYRPEIDGLRALAILPVVIFHSGINFMPGGFLGVDVFFVISGYLITSILLKEMNNGTFSFKSFYERRARRILPALFFMSVVSVLAAIWLLDPRSLQLFGQSLTAVSVFAANFFFYFKVDYFNPVSEISPLLHMWSLAVEEQFYIFFPILLLFLVRFKLNTLLIFSLILVVSFGWMIVNSSAQSFNFYMLHTRAWELCAGAIAAYVTMNRQPQLLPKLADLIAAVALCVLCSSYFLYDKNYNSPGWYSSLPVVATFLIIVFCRTEGAVSKVLSIGPFIYVGLISYSLYLWHQPVFAFAKIVTLGEFTDWIQWFSILIAISAAVVSYHVVETPLRKANFNQPNVLAYSSLSIVIVLASGLVLSQVMRFNSMNHEALQAVSPSRGLSPVCDFKSSFEPLPACRSADVPTVVVWGDSYAMHLVHGLSKSTSLIQATKNACSPNTSLATLPNTKGYDQAWADGCLQFNRQVMNYLQQSPEINTVVLSSTFEQWLQYDYWDGQQQIALNFETYQLSLQATISDIRKMGKKLVVVSPPPKNGRDIGQCSVRGLLGLPTYSEFFDKGCSFTKDQLSSQSSQIYDMLHRVVQGEDVVLVDLSNVLCDKQNCNVVDANPLYLDAGHLNNFGSDRVASYISEFVVTKN